MIKKSFSIIEIIFTISIISIILVVAIPKLNNSLESAQTMKIKNDIVLIREAITKYKNKMILKNNLSTIATLDDNSKLLFNKILQNPIVASNEQKISSWSKLSTNTYKVFIDNINSVNFTYNSSNYTFNCNSENIYCKELTQ